MRCVGLDSLPLGEWRCEECERVVYELNASDSPSLDPVENIKLRSYLEDPASIEGLDPVMQDVIRRMG